MGRAMGKRDYDTVARASAFGIWGSIVAGILFSILIALFRNPLLNLLGASAENWQYTSDYLFYTSVLGAMPAILNFVMAYMIRTEGSAIASSLGTIGGCLINVILDPFFILPQFLNMGAAGAGLATFISNVLTCIYFFILIAKRREKSFTCIDPRKAIPTKYVAKEVFSVGVPSAVQNLLNVTGATILNKFAAAFGSAAVSAMGISHKVCMLPLYVSMGMASGANPIAAYNYGSKNYSRAKECVRFTAILGVGLSVIIAVVYYIFSGGIIKFFIDSPEVINYGATFIRSMCIGTPFLAMDFIAVGVYQAFGQGQLALFFAIGRKVILEIPAIFILNKFYPLYGLAWAQTCAELILGIVALIVLVNIFKKLMKEKSAS